MATDDSVRVNVPPHPDAGEVARLAEEARAKAERIEKRKAADKTRDPDGGDHRGLGRHKKGKRP